MFRFLSETQEKEQKQVSHSKCVRFPPLSATQKHFSFGHQQGVVRASSVLTPATWRQRQTPQSEAQSHKTALHI